MKIALAICPSWNIDYPPIGIAYIAAYMKEKGYKIKSFDFNVKTYNMVKTEMESLWDMTSDNRVLWSKYKDIEKEHKGLFSRLIGLWTKEVLDENPQVIGFSVFDLNKHLTLKLAKRLKEKNPKLIIVLCGPHFPPYFKEEALTKDSYMINMVDLVKKDYIDFIILGEGEISFYELIKNLESKKFRLPKGVLHCKKGKVLYGGERKLIKNLDNLSFPDFSDFPIAQYKDGKLPIIFSRGCIGRCVFCHERNFWKFYRFRSAENVYKEMKRNLEEYNIDRFANNDSLINGNLKELEKLCDLIIKNKFNITWGGMAKLDPKMDKKLLKKLSKAGCNTISYGLESGSQKILNLMKKNTDIKSASRILRQTYFAKIKYITLNIMVGFPKESLLDFIKTLWFILKNKFFIGRIGTGYPCNIVPGSELFEMADEYGVTSLNKNEPLLWEIKDKYNTYKWRLRKLKILQKFVKILDLDSLNIYK